MRAICEHCGREQTIVLNYDIQTYPALVCVQFEERCKQCHRQIMLVIQQATESNVLDLMFVE